MLYIFHVDTGTMMTFDMNYALKTVDSLKNMIEEVCKIPADKQVLLVNGGEVLRSDARVCAYSAGTDTNPIYMFSKTIIESDEPPKSSFDYGHDVDFKDQVDKCLLMPPVHNTVVSYTNLAQKFLEQANENTLACKKLVHDQHLQQQGWAAVVANMEDVTSDFRERAEDFESKFKEQLSKRDEYVEFLNRFNDDLEILASIPILPALRLNAVSNPFTACDELHGDSESYDDNQEISEEKSNDINEQGSNNSQNSKEASGSTNSEGDGTDSSKEDREIKRSQFVRTKSSQNTKEAFTLLHWINIKENQESLKHIAEYCQSAMELFDGSIMTSLQLEINEALNLAGQSHMKHINGLEERLSGLEQLMCEAERFKQEQHDLAHAFKKQQNASVQLKSDVSILQPLCESLGKQLLSMLRNHQRLCDMRRRCVKAKAELSLNLYRRLKWIVYVENRMFETDNKLMFYHRSLSRLKRHLAVVSQLHKAPRLFSTALHEIVRRRTFSQAFLSWASDLACHLLSIHKEEVMRRRDFNTLFSGHFLGDLFPGTEDMPPPFATQEPKVFDADLPKLTQSDVDIFTSRLPHLTPEIPTYDMTNVIQFFKSRGFESETDTEEFEKVGQSPVERASGAIQLPAAPVKTDATTITEVRTHSRQPPAKPPRTRIPIPLPLAPIPEAASPHLECDCLLSPSLSSPAALSPRPPSPTSPTAAPGHRADFEPAEFYIEESPPVSLEWGCSASPLDSQTLVSLLQDNMENKRSEIENLKEVLSSLTNAYSQSINNLKTDLSNLKVDITGNQNSIKEQHKEVISAWETFLSDNSIRERENLQRITVDHELEMNDIKQTLARKDDKILLLEENVLINKKEYIESLDKKNIEVNDLLNKIRALENLVSEQNKKIDDAEGEKQKALKELQEKMIQENKAEVESLRSRFRLVTLTSMDRSPSESSLEKIERTDMIEISNHNAILLQTQVDLEEKKEEAVRLALKQSNEEWNIKYTEGVNKAKDAVKRIIEEKDRQLDQYRERESILVKECMKYKERIQQLTDSETTDVSQVVQLQRKEVALEMEKKLLEEKLKELSQKLNTSPLLIDVSTSTDGKLKQKMVKGHTPLGLIPKTLNISSCNAGDTVLVLWDGAHYSYTILQESPSLYILHNDSLGPLDLKIAVRDESERRLYAVGKVESKEYCSALKSGNKYQVAIGQRFYRVKVKPLKTNEIVLKDTGYCCETPVREIGSSQNKVASRMTMSDAGGNYDLSKSHCKETLCMSKSIYPAQLSTSLVDKFENVSEEKVSDEIVEKPNDNVLISDKVNIIKTDNAKSCAIIKEECNISEIFEEKQPVKSSEYRKQNISGVGMNINIQSVECVPYDTCSDICSTDGLSSEQVVSEIAEEAAP